MTGLRKGAIYVITAASLLFPALTFAQVTASPIFTNPASTNPFYANLCTTQPGGTFDVSSDSGGLAVWKWTGSGGNGNWDMYFYDQASNGDQNCIYKTNSQIIPANTGDYYYVFAVGASGYLGSPQLIYGLSGLGHYVFDGLTASSTFTVNGNTVTEWETQISDPAHFMGVFQDGGPSGGGTLPNGNFVYGFYVGPYVPVNNATDMESLLSSGSGHGPNTNINWSAIYTPLVFSTTTAAIAASSSLWGAFATTTQLLTVCNTGNLVIDTSCSVFAYLFVPNPELISGLVAIPGSLGQKAPFSFITSVQSLINTFISNVSTTTPSNNQWHYQNGAASSTITIFDASSSLAAFPLITTMQNYGGDMIYVGWAVSILFLVFKII